MSAPAFPGVRVVGAFYRGAEAVEATAALQPGDTLSVKREPENEYDQNAVAVYLGSIHIGYIERGQAAWLSPWLDQDVSYNCVVQELMTHRNTIYPLVDLTPAE